MSKCARRILVVDDNPAIHQDFRKILAGRSAEEEEFNSAEAALFGDVTAAAPDSLFELDFAFQGEQALELVKKASSEGRPYAMTFMDVRMPPGWDGVETTAKLWEIDPCLQVAFCTAYSDYSWEKVCAKLANVDSFVILKKPFEIVEVLQLANSFTAKWKLTQETQSHLRRLQESEARYELLTNAIPSVVWTANRAGENQYVNKQLVHYCGVPEEQLAGSGWLQFVHPEDLPAISGRWNESLSTGKMFEHEFRIRNVDGEYHWHLSRAHPLRNEQGQIIQWVGTLTDIEQQKRLEEALRTTQSDLERRVAERTEALARERDLLRVLMDNVPDCIYFKDSSFRFTRVSRAYARLLGLNDPQEAVGKTAQNCGAMQFTRQALVDERRMSVTGETMVDVREQLRSATGETLWVSSTKVPLRDKDGGFAGLVGISRDITERKRFEEELAYERELLATLLDSSPDYIYFKDVESRFLRCSRMLAHKFGTTPQEMVGKTDFDFFDEKHAREAYEDEQAIIRTGEAVVGKLEQERLKSDGRQTWALTNKMPLRDPSGKVIGTFGISKDVTALKQAEIDRHMMELQLRQAQKLEAIGQLAAGIAHEINTPTQYVGDNTRFLKESFESIVGVVRASAELLESARQKSISDDLIRRTEAAVAAADLDYLFEQIPAAIRETLEGVERVTKIVRAMKEFSHPGGKDKSPADLNKAIETTVTVARNEWKYVAEMTLDLDPALPLVPCLIGEFNQVILNLVVNAAHAIGDAIRSKPGGKGTITIQTRRTGDVVEIRVTDSGTGIPESVRPRIFEPFFTTKEVGKGSGQGLSIVYGSIVKKHSGSVDFETAVGQGTTFIVRLPIVPPSELKQQQPAAPRSPNVEGVKLQSV